MTSLAFTNLAFDGVVLRMPFSIQANYVDNEVWIEKATYESFEDAKAFAERLQGYGTYNAVRIVKQD